MGTTGRNGRPGCVPDVSTGKEEHTMKKLTLSMGAVAAALAASLAFAGPGGPGYGAGYGPGPGAGPCATEGAPGAGCGYGPGAGGGMGRGGGHGYAAQLLTPEERAAHWNAMHSFKSLEECNAYLADFHQLIATRAQEKGLPVPPQRGNMCERMAARGFFQ
jgi:hypothetical protein